ncbi:MAG: hypothetical protein E7561_06305 [Ruminococcaceae bacterium]|nr:hypothetical protein [Oscillospiraceae bacterium]
MSTFFDFIGVFCSAAMLFGGIFLLKPSGNTSKAVKYVFALIFLCIVISALLNIKIDEISIDNKKIEQSINTASLSKDFLKLTFEEVLRGQDINFNKITVCTNKTENGSITISKVTVYSKDSPEKIIAALGGNNAEYEIEVLYE